MSGPSTATPSVTDRGHAQPTRPADSASARPGTQWVKLPVRAASTQAGAVGPVTTSSSRTATPGMCTSAIPTLSSAPVVPSTPGHGDPERAMTARTPRAPAVRSPARRSPCFPRRSPPGPGSPTGPRRGSGRTAPWCRRARSWPSSSICHHSPLPVPRRDCHEVKTLRVDRSHRVGSGAAVGTVEVGGRGRRRDRSCAGDSPGRRGHRSRIRRYDGPRRLGPRAGP